MRRYWSTGKAPHVHWIQQHHNKETEPQSKLASRQTSGETQQSNAPNEGPALRPIEALTSCRHVWITLLYLFALPLADKCLVMDEGKASPSFIGCGGMSPSSALHGKDVDVDR